MKGCLRLFYEKYAFGLKARPANEDGLAVYVKD